MFEAILRREARAAASRAAEEPGQGGAEAARIEVRHREAARRLFGGLVPLSPEAALPADRLNAAVAGLVFPAPDPDRPLFERIGRARRAPPGRPADGAAPAPRPAPAPAVRPDAAPPGFEAVLRREQGPRIRRRVAWAGVGAGVQAILVGGAAALAAVGAAPPPEPELPVVQVRLASAATRRAGPPGAPRAPAMPAMPAARRPPQGARGGGPKVRPPPPTALLQPREIQVAMRAPEPGEAVEDWGEGEPLAPGEAPVVGGVVGGVPGGAGDGGWGAGASLEQREAPAAGGIEDAPRWATAGFRRPVEREAGCVGRAIRLPRDLAGFTSGPVTVRFAVGQDGAVGRLELLTAVPDARIAAAIEHAIRACAWRPGADATGRPVSLWVILPIRFESA